jgi:hypothetical protein
MPSWFRWLLVIPSSFTAWAGTLFLGMVAHSYAENAWCPPDELISGYCTNEAVIERLGLLVIAFAGVSAVAFVGAAVGMAPRRKAVVAWGAFAFGALIATALAGGSPESHAALALGATTSTLVTFACRRQ